MHSTYLGIQAIQIKHLIFDHNHTCPPPPPAPPTLTALCFFLRFFRGKGFLELWAVRCLLDTLDLQVPFLDTLDCQQYLLDTLDLKVSFGYLRSLCTFWLPQTFRYLFDTLNVQVHLDTQDLGLMVQTQTNVIDLASWYRLGLMVQS